MWPSHEADCCANTPPMRARALSLLHCIAKISLIRAFFSAQVNVICPSEKIMGTLYHNKASPQDNFFQRQKKPFCEPKRADVWHPCQRRRTHAGARHPCRSAIPVRQRHPRADVWHPCRRRRTHAGGTKASGGTRHPHVGGNTTAPGNAATRYSPTTHSSVSAETSDNAPGFSCLAFAMAKTDPVKANNAMAFGMTIS